MLNAIENSFSPSYSYPASYDAVVSVAAIDSNQNVAYFSQYNDQVELAGPGVNTQSTCKNSSYCSKSGTSSKFFFLLALMDGNYIVSYAQASFCVYRLMEEMILQSINHCAFFPCLYNSGYTTRGRRRSSRMESFPVFY